MKRILNAIVAEKLIVVNGKATTPVFKESVQFILRISEVLRRAGKKKEVDLNQSLVATLKKNRFFLIEKLQPVK